MADQFRAPYPIEDDDLGSLLTIDNLKSIRTDNQLPREFNDVLQTDGLYEIIEEYLSPLSKDIDLQITAVADTNITAMCVGVIQECTSLNGAYMLMILLIWHFLLIRKNFICQYHR